MHKQHGRQLADNKIAKNDKFAAVLRFATNRELTHEHERLHEHEHDSDQQINCFVQDSAAAIRSSASPGLSIRTVWMVSCLVSYESQTSE
jgi:hypothetical protein